MKNNFVKTPNINNFPLENENTFSKKIGQTIYVSTLKFNGNKKWNMASALARLIEKDISVAE